MKRWLCALVLALGFGEAQAGLVFEQSPDPVGGLFVSSWVPPEGTDYDNFVYDSFQLSSDTAVTEVRWRGGYVYTGYGLVHNFSVTFYASIAGGSQPLCGLPGDNDIFLAQYEVGSNAGEIPVGIFGGTQMYDYRFVLPTPFQAAANTKYWVQIEGYTAGLPFWGISAGNGGNNSHFEYSRGAHQFSTRSRDASFALYASDAPTFTVTTSASPVEAGTTSGGGAFPPGTTAVLIATANTGFGFVNWTENGTPVSSSPEYSFTVTANRSLVANFVTAFAITTSSQPVWGGGTSGGGVYNIGSSVTVVATPELGFDFVNWIENGLPVSGSPSYTFTAAANRALQADFALSAASVLFDFDSAVPPCVPTQQMPATQTSRGLTASFSAPSGAWSIQSQGTTGWNLSQFYANYLYPNTSGSTLGIGFSRPLTTASLDFCTADVTQNEIPTSVLLSAYTDSTKSVWVGSSGAHGTYGTDTFPMGTVTFTSETPFRYIEMETIWEPNGTNVFFVDNIVVITSAAASVPAGELPARFGLVGAPNPTRGPIHLSLHLAAGEHVRLSVHDVTGRQVREIASEWLPPGIHRALWDGRDDSGQAVSAGVYHIRVAAGREARALRAIVVR